ncbi:hypothetical protein NIES2100_42410 [Calothrix sp. NIES-2100]|uniref:hypothetical protein n=1 Tax=Calothrix sp. NIES-2100 TaxID=1954172 RepID=UPI000B5F5BFF|nr:hypothetical protein NIES2100_42410 [Calothrix sp. NIES-2100]
MNNFKFKSLIFYGVTIAGVLLLFKVVSAYGETSLKAPPAIQGHYRLALVEDIPNCEKPEKLILNIQQSGIYLNAAFVAANTNAETPNSHPKNDYLSGIFSDRNLSLSGKIDRGILCNIASASNSLVHSATMQMQLLDKGNLTGQLALSGSTRTFRFTAVPEKNQERSQKLKSH